MNILDFTSWKNTAIVLGRVYRNFRICSQLAVYIIAVFYTYGWPCAWHQSSVFSKKGCL